MNLRHLTLGIGLVVLLAGAGTSAEVKTKHLSCTFAATFVSGVETHLDTNGDTRSASVHQGIVNCNIGRFLFQEEFEFQPCQGACPVSCPAGTAEFDLVQAHGVLTAQKTGDQLFFEDAAGASTFCLNPDLTFSFTEQGTFAGGTGKYAGASGSFDGQGPGQYLVSGSKEGVFGGFGQFTETVTGTLNIPK
jgi:hypothetical protein